MSGWCEAPEERLFFALVPEPEAARRLHRAVHARVGALRLESRGAGPRWYEPWRLHLTLCFLGLRSAEQRQRLEAAAETVRFEPLELRLDLLGAFQRSAVLFSAPLLTPPGLRALRRRLLEALGHTAREPVAELAARPFRPHVTVARRVTGFRGLPLHAPVLLGFDHFALLRSVPGASGSAYRILRRFPPAVEGAALTVR